MKKDMCKHYDGILNDKCQAGIEYESFTCGERKGIVKKIPCLQCYNENNLSCDKLELPTDEEIKQFEKEIDEHFKFTTTALTKIQELHS